MNISPETVLQQAHQTWLNDPVTRQAIENINKLRVAHVEYLSRNATTDNDLELRCRAVSIRQIDALYNMLFNTTSFVQQAQNNK